MITLQQDSQSRALRQQKHQYYKQMLDQQVRYQQQLKECAVRSNKQQYDYNQDSPKYRKQWSQSLNSPNHAAGRQYLPANNPKRQEYVTQQHRGHSRQDIFDSLRDLRTQKPQQYTQPTQNYRYQAHTEGSQYFSPTRYNERMPYSQTKSIHYMQVPAFRTSQSRISSLKKANKPAVRQFKTIAHPEHNNPESKKKNMNVSARKEATRKARRSKHNLTCQTQKNKQEQSVHPTGINRKSNIKTKSNKTLNISASKPKNKVSPRPPQTDNNKGTVANLKQELSACLSQLAKYIDLKKQADAQEQLRKSQQVNQEVQAGLTSRELTNIEKQQQRQSKMHQMKLKALLRLRKIKEQSKDLTEVVDKPSKSQNRQKRSQTEFISPFVQQIQEQYGSQRSQRQSVQETKQYLDDFYPYPSECSQPQSPLLQGTSGPSLSPQGQSGQLVQVMMQRMEQQDQQNNELVHCVKQLSTYLKNTNEQIQQLSGPLDESVHEVKQTKSRVNTLTTKPEEHHFMTIEQQDKGHKNITTITVTRPADSKQKRQSSSQEQSKLKEAFLHRLKKARVRGSLLTQKIQAHSKVHGGFRRPQKAVDPEPGSLSEAGSMADVTSFSG